MMSECARVMFAARRRKRLAGASSVEPPEKSSTLKESCGRSVAEQLLDQRLGDIERKPTHRTRDIDDKNVIARRQLGPAVTRFGGCTVRRKKFSFRAVATAAGRIRSSRRPGGI